MVLASKNDVFKKINADLRCCNQKNNKMYSSNDFERLFIRYKAEALPSGESILSFCNRNKVPYNLFEKWYNDTRHRLVAVQANGRPSPEQSVVEESPSKQRFLPDPVRILVDIRMSNRIHIQQGNLDFDGLKRLVGNLEVLC